MDCLANPNLRAVQQQKEQERQRIREAVRVSREGSTVQEHLAYFVSDNKGWLIGGAIFIFLALISGVAVSMDPRNVQQFAANNAKPTPTAIPVEQLQQEASRREFARRSQENFKGAYPGITFEATGPRNDVLIVRHKLAPQPEFAERFKSDFKKQIRDLGFHNIILTNGKAETQITP